MARKLYYKILGTEQSDIPDRIWEEILRLQHWYNSEFIWSAGRLALKMFAVFPNSENTRTSSEDLTAVIAARQRQLEADGKNQNEIIRMLHAEGLVIIVKGGYFDDSLASGFTRTAGNEFNAYLVCEFLLKVSRILPQVTLDVVDEGEFIKPHHVFLSEGNVVVPADDGDRLWYYEAIVKNRRVFSVVDAAKYDNIPRFRVTVPDFGELSPQERMDVLRDRSWLGFENNYDINGDDIQGYDLNKHVRSFSLAPEKGVQPASSGQ